MLVKRMALLVLGLALMGCATKAEDQFVKVRLGMTQPEVRQSLGQPDDIKLVRYPGYLKEYEIWEYQMVPQAPT